ncbi:MAG: hypothetical protein HFH86_04455 [Bacilli bacterium]|jgi:spore maturation protein A|nr:hypothetical protein [Bacilli bacterium]
MVSIIWGCFILIGVIFSIATGSVEALNNQILKGASDGIGLLMEMLPILVLWTGVMKIAEDAGILQKFAHLVRPILHKLFPSLDRHDPALQYIASNIAANALGLGSAATPFGLKAMEEMQKKNPVKDTATEAMITFLILNTGGVTIIPTTVLALRLSHHSANPSEIILTSILATACSSFAGLMLDYIIRKRKKL